VDAFAVASLSWGLHRQVDVEIAGGATPLAKRFAFNALHPQAGGRNRRRLGIVIRSFLRNLLHPLAAAIAARALAITWPLLRNWDRGHWVKLPKGCGWPTHLAGSCAGATGGGARCRSWPRARAGAAGFQAPWWRILGTFHRLLGRTTPSLKADC